MSSTVMRPLAKNSPLRNTVGTAMTSRLSASCLNAAPSIIVWDTPGFSTLIMLSACTTSGQLWQLRLTNVSNRYSPRSARIRSMTSGSAFGGLPLTWSKARTKDENSCPVGTPANTTPVSSPGRFTLKDGVRWSRASSTRMRGDMPATSRMSSVISRETGSSPALTFSTTSPSSSRRYCSSCALISASSAMANPLDLAHQVEARLQRRFAFLPLGGAHFARMAAHVLRGLDLVDQGARIAADAFGGHFHGLDHAVRVDEEGGAVRHPG